jgi:hypothetical protein
MAVVALEELLVASIAADAVDRMSTGGIARLRTL